MSMNSLKNNASRYIALFLTISACIVFYFFVERFQGFADYVAKIVQIIRPFIFGGVIAYLLIPVSVFIDRWLCRLFRLSRREIRAKKQRTRRCFFLQGMLFRPLME